MTRTFTRRLAALALAVVCTGAANATQLTVSSYDMPNGDGQASQGTWNYWDATYTGSGAKTTDGLSGSTLSGGTGKLTDGVISTQPWYNVSNDYGTGEYVGWEGPDVATITFHFTATASLDEIKLWVDNTHQGGVFAPDAVIVNGVSYANPDWANPSTTELIDLTDLGIQGDSVTVTLHNVSGTHGYWVFLSEAQFFTSTVPEPGNVALLLAGLSALAWMARRRKS